MSDPGTLACAWIHGKVDIRDSKTGDVILKHSVTGPIANAFVSTDHQLVIVSTDGKGLWILLLHGFVIDEGVTGIDNGQSLLHELGIKKHNLLTELQNYEQCQDGGVVDEIGANEKKIPVGFMLQIR
ncbi:unnamed protein product [Gongylonema pulchrum]|uniref:PPM-type phosphatase domain-containing protein n=1 Tax=Gongylonema pulchrum TaxID=637853 RepID=A0A183ENQ4_9BILA|nr:unnamed protein product [Gongylonema pulchrum]